MLLLNEWIQALGLRIETHLGQGQGQGQGQGAGGEEGEVAFVELCISSKAFRNDPFQEASVPVTRDPVTILDLLGFETPVEIAADLCKRDVAERYVDAVMRASRFYSPDLLDRPTKAGGGGGDVEQLGEVVREIIFARLPRVKALWQMTQQQAATFDAVWDATIQLDESRLRPSLRRWSVFVKLNGLLPLSRMVPAEARAAWVAFRQHPSDASDWTCLSHSIMNQ